jgi:hypothetical protein
MPIDMGVDATGPCIAPTSACAKEPPPLPTGRTPGPLFDEVDFEVIDQQRLMKAMQVGWLQ